MVTDADSTFINDRNFHQPHKMNHFEIPTQNILLISLNGK